MAPSARGTHKVKTEIRQNETLDRSAWRRTISLWVLASGMAALTAAIITRDWILVVLQLAMLLLGSYLAALFWRPGETTQHITIENWHAGDPVCPRPESHV